MACGNHSQPYLTSPLITIWKSDSYFVQTQQFHVIVGLICKEEIICEKLLHR